MMTNIRLPPQDEILSFRILGQKGIIKGIVLLSYPSLQWGAKHENPPKEFGSLSFKNHILVHGMGRYSHNCGMRTKLSTKSRRRRSRLFLRLPPTLLLSTRLKTGCKKAELDCKQFWVTNILERKKSESWTMKNYSTVTICLNLFQNSKCCLYFLFSSNQ